MSQQWWCIIWHDKTGSEIDGLVYDIIESYDPTNTWAYHCAKRDGAIIGVFTYCKRIEGAPIPKGKSRHHTHATNKVWAKLNDQSYRKAR